MRTRIAAVVVALALLLGGFAVARWSANRSARIEARKARAQAGPRVTLRSKSKGKARGKARPGAGEGEGGVAARLMEPILAGPAREPVLGGPTNLVVVIGCSLRTDQLTPYGGHRAATPGLAERASHGVLFEHAVAAAVATRPASAALVTGFHAAQIGMVEPDGDGSARLLPDEVETLAEVLSSAGYQTFGMTSDPNLDGVFGFAQGFDGYVDAGEVMRPQAGGRIGGRALLETGLPALAELREPDRPLYLQVMLGDAHAPARPRKPELDRFEAGDVPQAVRRYRAVLHRFDAAVRVLEDSLAHQGLTRENTVFVVVGDHGEGLAFPRHHGRGHGDLTYPSTARMPWIGWGRGLDGGRRIGGVASQVDVMPTVLELVGVEGYTGAGSSWAAAMRGETDRTTRERAFVDAWAPGVRRSSVYAEALHCHDDWSPERVVQRACYTEDISVEPVGGEASDALLAELDAFRNRMEADLASFPYTRDAEVSDGVRAELEAIERAASGELHAD